MDYRELLRQMEANGHRVRALLEGVSAEQALWRPDPESWSILEVVNHLFDEEREDFRVRLDILLHEPSRPWPSIDPSGWVSGRRYSARDLGESLAGFLDERAASLAWLERLGEVDWTVEGPAPWGGTIRAGDMLAAWVVHDTLHLRQLAELHHAYLVHLTQPFSAEYAGSW